MTDSQQGENLVTLYSTNTTLLSAIAKSKEFRQTVMPTDTYLLLTVQIRQ